MRRSHSIHRRNQSSRAAQARTAHCRLHGASPRAVPTPQTQLADFNALTTKDALTDHYRLHAEAAPGARLDYAEAQPQLAEGFGDFDFSYICSYRATPGGPIAAAAWAEIMRTVSSGLERAALHRPIDGVLLGAPLGSTQDRAV